MRRKSPWILTVTAALAFAAFIPVPALAQGGGAAEESGEPPPRTVVPARRVDPTTPAPEAERRPQPPPRYQPRPAAGYPSGLSSANCDLPGGCPDSGKVPEGAITLEQLDAMRRGETYAPPAAPPVLPPAALPQPAPPAPPAYAAPAYGETVYESSKDKPVVPRHYIPGVSDRPPAYPAPAPAQAQPYTPPAPMPRTAPPAVAPAPAAPPAYPHAAPKSDLPGYSPPPTQPGSIRLEDLTPQSDAGYAPPKEKAPARRPPPPRQMDEVERIKPAPSPDEVERPPSRWEQ